jgi:hypothetical protein
MSEHENEEFYIGYLPQTPERMAKLVRRVIIALIVIAALTAVVLVAGQRRFPAAFFDFGHVRDFEGIVREYPYPALLARHEGQPGTLPLFTRYLLVGEGKHGANDDVAGMHDKQVQLKGTLIHRDNQMMIEVARNSVFVTPPSQRNLSLPETETRRSPLGAHTLAGEIVDSKCFLGVMNPGSTKVHRECAVRCISGGVMPMFIVRDAAGKSVGLLLTSTEGNPVNQAVLDFVAEPVEITGQVEREGDQLYLRADPKTYRRIR